MIVLNNDACNPFLYDVGHMLKDHFDNDIGNPLLSHHRLFCTTSSNGSLNLPSHRQDSTYYGLLLRQIGALAGTRNNSLVVVSAGLKPIGPIAPNWAPRPILQTLVQVDWEPGPTEIVPNWAPHLLKPVLAAAGFLYRYLSECLPYVRHHITVNKMC